MHKISTASPNLKAKFDLQSKGNIQNYEQKRTQNFVPGEPLAKFHIQHNEGKNWIANTPDPN